jgi:hypothetical protein
MVNRNEPVSLRLSRDEVQMLKGLAAQDGVSQSDILRILLRREWNARAVASKNSAVENRLSRRADDR